MAQGSLNDMTATEREPNMQELPGNQSMQSLETRQAAEVARLWHRLMWLSALFLVYGSLVPLNPQGLSWEVAVERFTALLVSSPVMGSRVDLASNVLLPMPLAFAAGQLLLWGRSSTARHAMRGVIVLGVLLLAMLVEFLQQFFPPRTLSLTDIQAQTVGGMLALLAQWRWGETTSAWLAGWWQRERAGQRVERSLKAYLLVLLGFNLLPLDLTLNPVEIYQKWSQGRVLWLPLSGLKGAAHEQLYELVTDVLVWLPVGVLLGLDRNRTFSHVVRTGMAAALLIEVLQLFVFSRVTDSTDVVSAAVGAALGALAANRWHQPQALTLDEIAGGVWGGLWGGWLLVVLAMFWYPFAFRWPAADLAWDWIRVPFATYQLADEFRATNEALRRVGVFLLGGLLWGFRALARRRSPGGLWPMLAVVVLVEAGQVFLPGKVADMTDAALGALGAWLGWRLAAWLYAPASQSAVAEPLQQRLTGAARAGQVLMVSRLVSPMWLPFLVLTGFLVVIAHLPSVPYNVRELVAMGPLGVVSASALAASGLLLARLPLAVNRMAAWSVLSAPLVAPLAGALIYAGLRVAVPLESIHDVVGAPVLGWPWEWERLLRFSALWTAGTLAVGLAGLQVAAVLRPGRLVAWINGALVVAMLTYPLYRIIVAEAATDNLTELLADHASLASMVWVGVGFCAVAMSGSALAAWAVQPHRWRRLLPVWLIGMGLAPWGLLSGLEPAVVKYGQVFSALQFLLSARRDAYLDGADLWFRLAAVLCGSMLVLAVLQYPDWRRFLQERQKV